MPLLQNTPVRILTLCLLVAGSQSNLLSQKAPRPKANTAQAHHQTKAQSDFLVIGYYPVYAASKYPFQDIHFRAFTHINLAFADVAADGSLKVKKNFVKKEWIDLAHQKGIRVNISVGGWGQGYHFPQVAASAAKRKRFARTAVAYLIKHNLQGLDIDWEFPKNDQQKNDFVKLARAIRQEMQKKDPTLNLMAALGASPYFLQFYDLAKMHKYFDFLALMTYDFHGPWTKVSGHNAPLHGSNDSWRHYWQLMQETLRQKMAEYNPLGLVDNQSETLRQIAQKEHTRKLRRLRNIQRYLKFYRKAGFQVDEGLIGIPFYGRSFTSKDIYQKYKKTKYITYRRIAKLEKSSTYQKKFDRLSHVPYLLHRQKDFIISYDDRHSVAAKIRFARRQGLRGVIVWEITQDMLPNSRTPLQQAIAQALSTPKANNTINQESSTLAPQKNHREQPTVQTKASQEKSNFFPWDQIWNQTNQQKWKQLWKNLLPPTPLHNIFHNIHKKEALNENTLNKNTLNEDKARNNFEKYLPQ